MKGLAIFISIVLLALIIFAALIMPETFDKHMSQVISLVGTLSALVSVIWTQYNKNVEENNKQKQFELDKKYQISKQAYQELFEEKIKLYRSLNKISLNWQAKLFEVGREFYNFNDEEGSYKEVIQEGDITIEYLKSFFELLHDKEFLLSDDIEKLYNKLYLSYKKHESEFQDILDIGGYSDEKYLRTENGKLRAKLYNQHAEDIESLCKLLQIEIKKMKSDIGFL